MDPNLPQQPIANKYDYLYVTPPAKRPFGISGDPKQKLLISVLFVGFVLIVLFVGFSVFSSLTKKDYTNYTKLVDQQTEIVRIIDSGLLKARGITAKNYTSTLRASTLSEKNEVTAFLKTNGVKIDEKKLATSKNAANDKVLADAQSAVDYDEKFVALVNKLVVDYQKIIASSVSTATAKPEQALVSGLQTNAEIIANAKSN